MTDGEFRDLISRLRAVPEPDGSSDEMLAVFVESASETSFNEALDDLAAISARIFGKPQPKIEEIISE